MNSPGILWVFIVSLELLIYEPYGLSRYCVLSLSYMKTIVALPIQYFVSQYNGCSFAVYILLVILIQRTLAGTLISHIFKTLPIPHEI